MLSGMRLESQSSQASHVRGLVPAMRKDTKAKGSVGERDERDGSCIEVHVRALCVCDREPCMRAGAGAGAGVHSVGVRTNQSGGQGGRKACVLLRRERMRPCKRLRPASPITPIAVGNVDARLSPLML